MNKELFDEVAESLNILGVSIEKNIQNLRKTYRSKWKKLFKELASEDNDALMKINAAYELLESKKDEDLNEFVKEYLKKTDFNKTKKFATPKNRIKNISNVKAKTEEERITLEKAKAEEERIALEKAKAEEERIALEKAKAKEERIENVVENKSTKLKNYFLAFVGCFFLGGFFMSIFEYLSKESVYESENSESIDQSLSFLEIEDLMSLNPNDANLLRGVERNSRLINHGNFSVDLSTVQIDYVHFNSYSHITYKAKVKNNGVPQNQYSLDCSTGKKYNWDLNEWVIPKSRDEKTLLNTICNDKENDPKIISLLDEYNWKKYSNNQWLNVNNWVEDKKTSYEDFDTEFYTLKDQEIS